MLETKDSLNRCPRCGSGSLDGGFVEVDGRYAWQRVRCGECGLSWVDTYRFDNASYFEDEDGSDVVKSGPDWYNRV